MNSLRERFDRWLVQLQWSWREMTWAQFIIRASAWGGIIAAILLAAWWWRSRGRIDPDLETLRSELRSGNANVRHRAYDLLMQRDDAAACFAYALHDDRPEIRSEAAAALATYKYSTAPAAQALVDVLDDPEEDEDTRYYCAQALDHRAKERADLAIPALRRAILNPTGPFNVRLSAEVSLRELQKSASGGGASQSETSSPP